MKQYSVDEFVWFVPTPKNKCAINFQRERAFNLNAALCTELGHQIEIGFHSSEKVLCLRKATGNGGLKVPLSGSITLAELSEKLVAADFKPPIRFAVIRQDDCWIAIPKATQVPEAVNVKKPSRRPRKVDPARLLEGVNRT